MAAAHATRSPRLPRFCPRALVAAALVATACGDKADTQPPRVVSNTPGVGAQQIARDAPIVVELDEPIDDASLTVTGAGGVPVDGALLIEGRTVRFVPARGLFVAAEITVTGTATDRAGNVGAIAAWSFTTAGTWGAPQFAGDCGDAWSPRARFTPADTLLALGSSTSAGQRCVVERVGGSLAAAHYLNVQLGTFADADLLAPRDGPAILFWYSDFLGGNAIAYATGAGTQWSTSYLSTTDDLRDAAIAVHDRGLGVIGAIYGQATRTLRAWTVADGVVTTSLNPTAVSGGADQIRAAADTRGNAVLVWADVAAREVSAIPYRVTSGWGAPILLGSAEVQQKQLGVTLDEDGVATVIWRDGYPGAGPNGVWATTVSTAGATTIPQRIDTSDAARPDRDEVRLTTSHGGAVASWFEILDGDNLTARAVLRILGPGGFGPEIVGPPNDNDNHLPVMELRARLDGAGRLAATWVDLGGRLCVGRHVAGSWQSRCDFPDAGFGAAEAALAVDHTGRLALVTHAGAQGLSITVFE